jgi:hypothetical protein
MTARFDPHFFARIRRISDALSRQVAGFIDIEIEDARWAMFIVVGRYDGLHADEHRERNCSVWRENVALCTCLDGVAAIRGDEDADAATSSAARGASCVVAVMSTAMA